MRCAQMLLIWIFFYFSPLTADNRGHQHFFFPRTFLSDCYWSSLIGADIGLLSGEHADIHGHSRTFITMSSVSLPFAFPQWKNVKNQELYGKNNSAADLYHAARSAHKSTTALSKSLLWYLPTNAIQRLTKKTKNTYMFIRFHKYRSFFFTFAPISMTNKSISNL